MVATPPASSVPAETAPQPEADTVAAAPAPALLPSQGPLVKGDDITAALTRLLGRDAVLKFIETTDYPRNFVATLDNLGREHAPVSVWPVRPSPGRFLAAADGASQVIATENELRYAPFVAFAASINSAQSVDLYRRMYPTLDRAYRELGFPNRPLHARVFEVIDLLLATPEPAQLPRITLTEVKGSIPSTRPWTHYEYADAQLQRLTAGQKILLRVGPANRKVLKAKLQEIRKELLQVSSDSARP